MGLNELCKGCRHLTHARFVTLRDDREGFSAIYNVPIDNGDVSKVPQAESRFRLSWPTHKLLKNAHIKPAVSSRKRLLLKSLREIRHGAAQGCHLCYLFVVEEWRFRGLDSGIEPHVFGFPAFRKSSSSAYDLDLDWNFYIDPALRESLIDVQSYGLRDPWPSSTEFCLKRAEKTTKISAFDEYTGGIRTKTLTKLRKWLEDCTSHDHMHASCATGVIPNTQLPARLLKLEACKSSITVKLIETQQDHGLSCKKLIYATLSHCWGRSGVPVKLIEDNYTEWLNRIPLRTLSKTFQEAIMITHTLGLVYLWIDALCIIQDSDSDWHKEAPRMQAIYAGSLVTLAATASEDGQGGLLAQKDLPTTCIIRFNSRRFRSIVHGSYFICVRDWAQAPYVRYIDSAPLNRRAWVLQEKLLSSRLIHFASNEIWWQCSAVGDKETWHSPSSDAFHDMTLTAYAKATRWNDLVEIYSHKHITRVEDRLVAFAGIAEAYGQRHQLDPSTYCAGLWRHQIESQLLWSSKDKSSPPYMHYQAAPSWSWASCASPVTYGSSYHYPTAVFSKDFKVTQVDVQLRGPSAFAAVSVGRLCIESVVLEIIHYTKAAMAIQARNGQDRLENADFESAQVSPSKSGSQSLPLAPTHALPLTHVYDSHSFELLNSPVALGNYPYAHVFGLLLLRSVEEQKGTYLRTDIWWVGKFGEQEELPAWWTVGCELTEDYYLRSLGSGKYEIAII